MYENLCRTENMQTNTDKKSENVIDEIDTAQKNIFKESSGLVVQSRDVCHNYYTKKRLSLYKTEMCRSFEESNQCKYGERCQFAHNRSELRTIQRHPRYKTEICKTFWDIGTCPYGKRCCFVHTKSEPNVIESIHDKDSSYQGSTIQDDAGCEEIASNSTMGLDKSRADKSWSIEDKIGCNAMTYSASNALKNICSEKSESMQDQLGCSSATDSASIILEKTLIEKDIRENNIMHDSLHNKSIEPGSHSKHQSVAVQNKLNYDVLTHDKFVNNGTIYATSTENVQSVINFDEITCNKIKESEMDETENLSDKKIIRSNFDVQRLTKLNLHQSNFDQSKMNVESKKNILCNFEQINVCISGISHTKNSFIQKNDTELIKSKIDCSNQNEYKSEGFVTNHRNASFQNGIFASSDECTLQDKYSKIDFDYIAQNDDNLSYKIIFRKKSDLLHLKNNYNFHNSRPFWHSNASSTWIAANKSICYVKRAKTHSYRRKPQLKAPGDPVIPTYDSDLVDFVFKHLGNCK